VTTRLHDRAQPRAIAHSNQAAIRESTLTREGFLPCSTFL
jgi:hypothetical protein